MKCPKCGTEVEGKFCTKCGTKLPDEIKEDKRYCPKCGAEVSGKHCPSCGFDMDTIEDLKVTSNSEKEEATKVPEIPNQTKGIENKTMVQKENKTKSLKDKLNLKVIGVPLLCLVVGFGAGIGVGIGISKNGSSSGTSNNEVTGSNRYQAAKQKQSSSSNSNKNTASNDSGSLSSSSASIKNVTIEEAGRTKAGDIVVKVTNNNDSDVYVSEMEAIFKDKDGNFAYKQDVDDTYDLYVPAKGHSMAYFWGYDKDFSKYASVSFKADIEDDDLDDLVGKNIELNAKDNGSEIAVTYKNNGTEEISGVSVLVVYYKNNEIVGVNTGYDDNSVSPNSEGYINVDYPEDSNYDSVSFDTFETYLYTAD